MRLLTRMEGRMPEHEVMQHDKMVTLYLACVCVRMGMC